MQASQNETQCHNKQPWRKILYVDQGMPDNYVPDSFLTEMKKNLHLRKYSYWSLVLASGCVTQQISTVASFISSYALLFGGIVSPTLVCLVPAALTGIGYSAAAMLASSKSSAPSSVLALRTAAVFAIAACVLSPVLMTLTDAISTDTVYAMTAVMLLSHLVARDYDDDALLASDSLSFNAGVFASVCLASKLRSVMHTLGLVALAIQLLALWPHAARQARLSKAVPWWIDVCITAVLAFVAASSLFFAISAIAAVLCACLLIFVTFICPFWLLQLQHYKDNIYGPWDEATISD